MSGRSPRPIPSSRGGGQPAGQPPDFELLQVVYVRDGHPDLGLAKGECGTVMETFQTPYPAYLIEFINDDGSTRVEAAFTPDQLSATPPPP